MTYPTPHINAKPEDFAKTVLMPGDPKRSRFIAENFLTDVRLVNDIRGVQGYTGLYNGKAISVMASGMGMPSIGIYSYELYNFFGVENIIRVGSAGGINDSVGLRDIIIAQGACTDSNFAAQFGLGGTFAPIADFKLLQTAVNIANEKCLNYHVGNILSSDIFYNDDVTVNDKWKKMGVLCVEMEAAALYMNAARAGKKALTVCTCSDHLYRNESVSAEERENSFTEMINLTLETAFKI
jgi:purine-nucleoside phosphorylase